MSYSDLPTFIPTEETNLLCKEECECPSEEDDTEKLDTDRRLRNWNKWMEERKRIHKTLGDVLNRKAGDLIMNAYEDYRCTNEEKDVFDYTKILTPPDKERGSPSFWSLPISLPDECDRTLPTEYTAQMTPFEKCEIPELTYIKVPDYIKDKEKCILPKSREGYESWKNLKYRKKRYEELSNKIKLIQPHKPDLTDFIVVGIPIEKPKRIRRKYEEECLAEEEEESFKTEDEPPPIFILNKMPLYDFSAGTQKTIVNFDYDLNTKRILTKEITLENFSSFVVRFKFTQLTKSKLFKDIIPEQKIEDQVFHFNKNEELVLPHNNTKFQFHFKTDQPGCYTLNLEFSMLPDLCPNAHVVVNLVSFSDDWKKWDKLLEIHQDLKAKVRDAQIKDSLSEVLRRIPYQKYKPKTYTYNKKRIFEAVNTYFDPYHKLPKYKYNKEIVDKLEEIYNHVKTNSDSPVWNLNIDSLKIMVMNYDIVQLLEEDDVAIREYHLDKREEMEMKTVREKLAKLTTCELPPKKEVIDSPKKEKGKKGKKSKSPEKESKKSSTDKKKGGKKSDKKDPSVIVEDLNPNKRNPVEVLADKEQKIKECEEKLKEMVKRQKKLGDRKPMLLEKFEELVKQLEVQPAGTNRDQEKYDNVYMILCAHFDYLTEQIDDLKERTGVTNLSTNYPVAFASIDSPRVKIEEKPNIYKEKISSGGIYPPKTDKPFPEFLKDIPLEETKLRYKLYYNIPDQVEDKEGKNKKKGKKGKKDKKGKKEGSKKGGGKGDKKGKGSKASGKGKKGKKSKEAKEETAAVEEEEKFDIDPDFYPYGECATGTVEENIEYSEIQLVNSNSELSQGFRVSESVFHQYRKNLYILFYYCIENAALKIADYLESLEPEITLTQIKLVEQCNSCGLHFKGTKAEDVEFVDLRHALATEDLRKVCYGEPIPYPEVQVKSSYPLYAADSKDSPDSLLEILKHYDSTQDIPKPISYPECVNVTKRIWRKGIDLTYPEVVEVHTETSDTIVDPNWSRNRSVGIQKYLHETATDKLFFDSQQTSSQDKLTEKKILDEVIEDFLLLGASKVKADFEQKKSKLMEDKVQKDKAIEDVIKHTKLDEHKVQIEGDKVDGNNVFVYQFNDDETDDDDDNGDDDIVFKEYATANENPSDPSKINMLLYSKRSLDVLEAELSKLSKDAEQEEDEGSHDSKDSFYKDYYPDFFSNKFRFYDRPSKQ